VEPEELKEIAEYHEVYISRHSVTAALANSSKRFEKKEFKSKQMAYSLIHFISLLVSV